MARCRVGVLVSGEGTNLQALLDASKAGAPFDVAVVVSNKAGVRALDRARAAGVPAHVVLAGGDREAHERAIADALDGARVDVVALAGYMRLLTPWFVRRYAGRLLNVHPSFLPAFRGARAVRQALDAKADSTGCTVHFVTDETDAGPIVLQERVPILPGDDEATLAARIREAEHRLYPAALRLFAEGRLRIESGHVTILPEVRS